MEKSHSIPPSFLLTCVDSISHPVNPFSIILCYNIHMNLIKLVVLSRKIHRLLVFFIVGIGLVMMTTGITLERAGEGESFLPFLNASFARNIHNKFSILFALILFMMMLTGLTLYLYPWIQKTLHKNP